MATYFNPKMTSRATRNSVRTSSPATQQNLNKNFVSGGSVQPANIPVVSYQQDAAPAAPQPPKVSNMDTDGDVAMETAANSADLEALKAERKKYWLNVRKTPGMRKKPTKQMVQKRLRKHLAPRNATVALSEVCPGVQYKFATIPDAQPPVFTAEVEVNGKAHHGVGSSKSLARAAAAELALQSFVRSPTVSKDEAGQETVEDSTPWSALAGFALHKLFCDWRQGKVGVPLSVEAATPQAAAQNLAKSPAAAAALTASFKSDAPAPGAFQSFSVPTQLLKEKKKAKSEAAQKPKAPKVPPTDAAERHPVTLLHEMRPGITFETVANVLPQSGGATEPSFTVQVAVDGQTFAGTGRLKKDAKRVAAQNAMTGVFGIQYAPAPAQQ